MKKILFIVILVVVCSALFAEANFYGSARVGLWYDITDEDHANGERTSFDQSLQEDSHLGIDFTRGNVSAKVEFGFNASNNRLNIDYLWARYNLRNWAIVVGRDDFGSCMLANQSFRSGMGLDGYGALSTGPLAQVRFEVNFDRNLLYIAFMEPASRSVMLPVHYLNNTHNLVDPTPHIRESDIDLFMPRLMFGYNVYHPNFRFMPMAMFQAFKFNEDRIDFAGSYDDIKVSWLIAMTSELVFDQLSLRVHGHYGQNLGNMGFAGDFNRMVGYFYRKGLVPTRPITLNTAHAVCLGGHFAISYDFCEVFNMNAGVGYATTETTSKRFIGGDPEDLFYTHNDDRMALYLQAVRRINNFSIVPEFGMIMERKDQFGHEQGNQMYFGTQLRFDF